MSEKAKGKDIELVRLVHAAQIQSTLLEFDDCVQGLYERKKSIEVYSQKLADHANVICLRDEEGVEGIVCFYNNDHTMKQGFIAIIWVKRKKRRNGIGLTLLARCLDEMKRAGMQKVTLEVDSINTNAIGFYKRNGFVIEEQARQKQCYFMSKLI